MHINTIKKIAFIAIAIGLFAFVSSAHAKTYEFGHKLTGDGPVNPGHFADLTIIDNGSGSWTFTLDVFSNFADIFGTEAFVGSVAIDNDLMTKTEIDDVNITNVSGGVAKVTIKSASGPQNFEYRFDEGQGANDRLFANESVNWTASNMIGALPNDGEIALHVQGLTVGDSVWQVSPVPEPEIYVMFLIGLGLVAFVARRRKADIAYA